MATLQTHYRRDMEMGRQELTAAGEALDRLDALARRASSAALAAAPPDAEAMDRFRAAMDDDFNTPEAVATLFDCVRRANTAIDDGEDPGPLLGAIADITGALGVAVRSGAAGEDAEAAEIDALIAERAAARAARDFAAADRVRDELAARGVVLEDTADGTLWHRAGPGA